MFRNRKNKVLQCIPKEVYDTVPKSTIIDNTEHISFVKVPNSEVQATLPKYSDYQLSKLLEANIPLQEVRSTILENVPSNSDIETIVSNVEKLK